MLIVGLSFAVMAVSLSSMVSDFLFSERVRSDRVTLQKLALRCAAPLDAADSEELSLLMEEGLEELDGRLLILDASGKVQSDTQGSLCGIKLTTEEIYGVLVRGKSVDYGVHEGMSGEKINTGSLIFTALRPSSWMSFCASPIVLGDDIIGAVLLISPVDDMMEELSALQQKMLIIFAVVAAAAICCSLVFSRVITGPVIDLTRVIQRMSRGHFSARVKVRGSGEMRHLAEAFNSMSEKIETLDESRNQFVSNASHELKTPLATMKIMLESLIYQPDMDKELRTEFLSDINREIDRLSAIIGDLLTLVRMDESAVHLNRESLSVAALVKENAHRLTGAAQERGQTINLSLQDPCDLYADRSKLNQIIYNLMENAVKYTQEGGNIRVTLQRNGRDAVLNVQDNGPGIPRESLPHIFDRFYRVDKARSRDSGGTGLGLSIVHQLVLLHGGSIRCESVEGQGTSFIVELPMHEG